MFDPEWYLQANPDVAQAGMDAEDHYFDAGYSEGRSPSPYFIDELYYSQFDEPPSTEPAIHHYIKNFAARDIVFNEYFDATWYSGRFLLNAVEDATEHFFLTGSAKQLPPGPRFLPAWYLSLYADVREAELDPFRHFVQSGHAEARIAHPSELASAGNHDAVHDRELRRRFEAKATVRRVLGDAAPAIATGERRLYSFIVPVFNIDPAIFNQLLRSVAQQTYTNWQICASVAKGQDKECRELLKSYSKEHNITIVDIEKNGGISYNSNACLAKADGEYIILLDHDDLIPSDALECIQQTLEADSEIDFLYSDKDLVDDFDSFHSSPLRKPSWSPDIMWSANYLTHLNVIRRSLVQKIGGWDEATDGAQDWDIFLRAVRCEGVKVAHLDEILYHWRLTASSTAVGGYSAKPYAATSQLRTLNRHVADEFPGASISFVDSSGKTQIRWGRSDAAITVLNFSADGKTDAGFAKNMHLFHSIARVANLPYDITFTELDRVIRADESDVILCISAGMEPCALQYPVEILGPLEAEGVGAATGKLLLHDRIFELGAYLANGEAVSVFRDAGQYDYSLLGSADWYRNANGATRSNLAFKRSTWIDVFDSVSKPLSEPYLAVFFSALEEKEKRVFVNPYALSYLTDAKHAEQIAAYDLQRLRFHSENRYINRNLYFNGPSKTVATMTVAKPSLGSTAGGDEAGYVASAFTRVKRWEPPANSREDGPVRTILWLLPGFDNPFYGGVMTILRTADYFQRVKGVSSTFLVYADQGSPDFYRSVIGRAFPKLAERCGVMVTTEPAAAVRASGESFDIGVCSLWTTAYGLLDIEAVRSKLYFVQDYEPLFYPSGTVSAAVEATYRFGFTGICNTQGIYERFAAHGGAGVAFKPAVDRDVFYPGERSFGKNQKINIFWYGRPGHLRNGFELVREGVKALKEDWGGNIEIFAAGADWDLDALGLRGVVTPLGLLEYRQTGALYRRVDIGISMMTTPHPSYLPFELMACGAVVCSNVNRDTEWFFNDGKNCLQFEPVRDGLVCAVNRLIREPKLRKQLSAAGERTITQHFSDWEVSCAYIADAMERAHFGEISNSLVCGAQS